MRNFIVDVIHPESMTDPIKALVEKEDGRVIGQDCPRDGCDGVLRGLSSGEESLTVSGIVCHNCETIVELDG